MRINGYKLTISVFVAGLLLFLILSRKGQIPHDLWDILRDQRLQTIYIRTIRIAFTTSLITMLLGLALAYFLFETNFPGQSFFQAIYYWPLILPPYFLGAAWLAWLGNFGLFKNSGLNLTSEAGCIFIGTLYLLPLIIISIGNASQNNEAEQKEAALLMGGHFRYLWRIWLPRVIPAALAGGLLVLIMMANNYSIPAIFNVNTLSTEVYAEFGAFYNFYRAALKVIPLLLLFAGLIILLGQRFQKTLLNFQLNRRKISLLRGKISRGFGFLLWSGYFLAALLIPVLGLTIQTKSLTNLGKAISLAGEQIAFSFWFSAMTAAFIVIPGFLFSYVAIRRQKNKVLTYITALLLLPPVFAGILLVSLLNRPGLNFIYDNGLLLYLGYLVRFLPLIFILLIPAIRSVPKELEEASYLSGQSLGPTWRKILLPLILPSLLIAWLISFFFCNGEAECSILLYPPGLETIAMRTLSLLHYGTSPMVNGLVLAQVLFLGFIALGCMGLYKLIKHRMRKGGPDGNQ